MSGRGFRQKCPSFLFSRLLLVFLFLFLPVHNISFLKFVPVMVQKNIYKQINQINSFKTSNEINDILRKAKMRGIY